MGKYSGRKRINFSDSIVLSVSAEKGQNISIMDKEITPGEINDIIPAVPVWNEFFSIVFRSDL